MNRNIELEKPINGEASGKCRAKGGEEKQVKSRLSGLSLASLHGVSDQIPTGGIGTMSDGLVSHPDSENLQFRVSPQSCKILGSAPRKKHTMFTFEESGLPEGGKSFHSESLVSPTLMVIENLKYRLLKSHKSLISKAKAKDKWESEEHELIDCTEELHTLLNTDFSKLDSDQSLDLIIANKKLSLAFQQLVWTCWFGKFSHISNSILKGIKRLISHHLGNYILQKIVEKDIIVREATEVICRDNFGELCTDQYASRVIQTLIETSESFRVFATGYFREHAWTLIESMPAVYLFVTVIKCSKADSEIRFVRDMIASNYSDVLEGKYMKRIAVSYLIKVKEESLPELFLLFKLKKKLSLVKLFNDKFLPYVLLTFICRGYSPAIGLLAFYIENNLKQLLKTKHFMFIIMKAFSVESIGDKSHEHNTQVVDTLVDALCSGTTPDFRNQRFSFFCYSLLNFSSLIKKKKLAQLIAFLEKELDRSWSQSSNYYFNLRRLPTF